MREIYFLPEITQSFGISRYRDAFGWYMHAYDETMDRLGCISLFFFFTLPSYVRSRFLACRIFSREEWINANENGRS